MKDTPFTEARLLSLYDRVAEAEDAIPRLRRFVLDLAVRGKLVPQEATEEPAPDLLKRLGTGRATAPDLPTNWLSARLNEVIDLQYGKGLEPKLRMDAGPVPVFGSNGVVCFTSEPLTAKPSVIVGRKGSAGALNVCDGPSWTTDVAYFVEVPSFFTLRYLFSMLSTLDLDRLGKGVKPGLSRSDAYELSVAVPPLAEQHRIVAKVEELMALLDRLEAARVAREETRTRLTAATLSRLTEADTDTPTAARFALQTLPALTTRPDQIKTLRQTILNLAVRGKLVEQDKTDSRANQRLLRPDHSADSFDLEAFAERAAKFKLPTSWTIEPLSRVAQHIVDCPHTTPKWTVSGVLCVRTNQIRAGRLDLNDPNFVSEETYQVRIERLEPKTDDILYIREGGILGVACRIPPSTRLCLGQRLMLIRANGAATPQYLELCLNSPWITMFAAEKTTGGAAPRVNMSIVRGFPIPLPPIAEQHRIVAKVEELMSRCERLERALQDATTTRARLLDATLHEALASAQQAA